MRSLIRSDCILRYFSLSKPILIYFSPIWSTKLRFLPHPSKQKIEKEKKHYIDQLIKKDSINFKKLSDYINEVDIIDIDDRIKREIGGNHPLSQSMFISILQAALTKLYKNENKNISYNTYKDFKTIYPKEVDDIWNIMVDRLPILHQQFIKYQQEKFNRKLKKA